MALFRLHDCRLKAPTTCCHRLFCLLLTVLASMATATDFAVAPNSEQSCQPLQKAIDAAPDHAQEPVVIRIAPGTYRGHIVIPASKSHLVLRGDDAATTILTDNHTIHDLDQAGNKIRTPNSATVLVNGDDFHAENITFENSAGNVGQALAIYSAADRVSYRNCRFLGWQDTVRAEKGRQHFLNCSIAGHCDFIYGNATAVFENCRLHCLADGYITAASTAAESPFGYVFIGCQITAAPGVKRTYLGRPWRPYASVTWLNTTMAAIVDPAGWDNWQDPSREQTARYAEYNSSGPGGAPERRAGWSRQLTAAEAAAITPIGVLRGTDNWQGCPK